MCRLGVRVPLKLNEEFGHSGRLNMYNNIKGNVGMPS